SAVRGHAYGTRRRRGNFGAPATGADSRALGTGFAGGFSAIVSRTRLRCPWHVRAGCHGGERVARSLPGRGSAGRLVVFGAGTGRADSSLGPECTIGQSAHEYELAGTPEYCQRRSAGHARGSGDREVKCP